MSLRWGILGTGNIAKTFATALQVSKKGSLVAVGSRSDASAVAFGQQYGLDASQCHGSYEAVLQDPNVDIVYICSPHPCHHAMALQAAQAKKHMLVEKPLAMTEQQVQEIIQACRDHHVFLMEAYMYRCHPQTRQLVDLIRAGDKIGQVKLIRANFSFDGRPLGPSSRLWRNELGGGAIMDIGGYPMSFARLIAGVAQQKEFANPTKVKGTGYIQPDTQVDEWAIASLEFEHGITAQLFTGVFADSDCYVEVIGSEGSFKVPNLWRPDLGPVQIEYKSHSNPTVEIINIPLEETNLFAMEADAVADALLGNQLECKYMTLDDTLGQVRAMDQWRKEIGLCYQEDQV
ncbi:uncharacterized protein BX664DRAFT_329291 [Halteromyces radiatus]|uniref:uncharacterized protein n=1 Tax=Halteromyces radiatus TaxID=101107 RepID=UPI00221F9B24|nr:uncharacterized protein BX664DRAFT_329291 [Halteromyces radiatus]KAI8093250.1 hypothetical protein BX664DRAFT_329291 [Halteromyces radiatus]